MPTRDRTFRGGEAGSIWRSLAVVVACAAGVVLGAGCSGSDVGPGAAAATSADGSDTGVVDVADSECRGIDEESACRGHRGCEWWAVTCEQGRVLRGCYPSDGWRESSLDCRNPQDAGAPAADATASCAEIGGSDRCRAQTGCRWRESDCGPDRCIDRSLDVAPDECADAGTGGDTAGAGDASHAADASRPDAAVDAASDAPEDAASMPCHNYSDESTCQARADCRWWVDACDGEIVDERCIGVDASPEPSECRDVPPEECGEADSRDSCYAPNCEWVEQGCGSVPTGAESIRACVPSEGCRRDADCPAEHRCTRLWVDPCYDSACLACGGETRRCVPESLLGP